jgi:hypothetical protein
MKGNKAKLGSIIAESVEASRRLQKGADGTN